MRKFLAILAVVAFGCGTAQADVRVPNLFSDNMVLQREIAVPVWGQAEKGEKVTVKIGGSEATATADAQGKWMVKLPAMKANAQPQDLVISGKNTLTIKNVVVGDVWFCSGQSNMEMTLGGCDAPEDVAKADLPLIRRVKYDHVATGQPRSDAPGHWEVCSPGSAGGFTAVGFYFARRIQNETGLPIGLIDDNWGGTRIEPWIPPCGFEGEPSLAGVLDDVKNRKADYRKNIGGSLDKLEAWIAETRKAVAASADPLPTMPAMPQDPMTDAGFPTTLYNGMVAPVAPYAIKGALWYQGESNGGEGDEYYFKTRALVNGWRKVWQQGDFPFYFVQLANFVTPNENPEGGDGWAKVRMAQTKSLAIPKTGMALAIDIGDAVDIHPKNKYDLGERLALWALKNDYGKTDIVCSGPLYKSMKVEGNKIRLSFDYTGKGLIVGKKEGRKPTVEDKGGKLKRFAIAGEDKKWVWADAVIDGDTVVVSNAAVAKPVAVRYAFSMNPVGCNLYNQDGLPASPFRTDEW